MFRCSRNEEQVTSASQCNHHRKYWISISSDRFRLSTGFRSQPRPVVRNRGRRFGRCRGETTIKRPARVSARLTSTGMCWRVRDKNAASLRLGGWRRIRRRGRSECGDGAVGDQDGVGLCVCLCVSVCVCVCTVQSKSANSAFSKAATLPHRR